MGDISDALKRAKDEREGQEPAAPARSNGEFAAALKWSQSAQPMPAPASPPGPSPDPQPAEQAPARAPMPISREPGKTAPARTVLLDEHGAGADAYRHFALRVRRSLQSRGVHSIMIVSALRHEG
jgi:hypothetical protein